MLFRLLLFSYLVILRCFDVIVISIWISVLSPCPFRGGSLHPAEAGAFFAPATEAIPQITWVDKSNISADRY